MVVSLLLYQPDYDSSPNSAHLKTSNTQQCFASNRCFYNLWYVSIHISDFQNYLKLFYLKLNLCCLLLKAFKKKSVVLLEDDIWLMASSSHFEFRKKNRLDKICKWRDPNFWQLSISLLLKRVKIKASKKIFCHFFGTSFET